jgi:putative FmdB family regulatory protein
VPTYEYKCTFCDNVVEVERSITEDEVVPKCYLCEEPTKRIYSSAAAHFKGQGWGKVYRKKTKND